MVIAVTGKVMAALAVSRRFPVPVQHCARSCSGSLSKFLTDFDETNSWLSNSAMFNDAVTA